MPRRILVGEPARRAISRGASQLARAVRVTLGPRGRTVLVDQGALGPAITNDGAAVAREVELPDPFENLGARLMREASQRTFEEAGDGTSSAIVLAHAILVHGLEQIAQGHAPVQLKRGIEHAARAVSAHLRAQARPLKAREERLAVAAIAAGGDLAAAALVEEALAHVGFAGVVTIRAGHATACRLDFTPGAAFDRGWLSAYFITHPEDMRCLLERPLVLMAAQRLDRPEDVAPALEAARALGRPLLVLAEDIEGGALQTLVVNQLRGVVQACAVQAPGLGAGRRAWLEGLARASAATLFGPEGGREAASAGADDLGRFQRAVIERAHTTLGFDTRAGAAESGGVATIEVGAPSAAEALALHARLEDALTALRSALSEGVVTGGGVALLRAQAAARAVPLTGGAKAGAEAVAASLGEPARWIAQNAGADGEEIVAALEAASGETGFDASQGRIVDLARAGILDPARVVRVAFEQAAAVAALILTTETLVVDDGEPEPPQRDEPEG